MAEGLAGGVAEVDGGRVKAGHLQLLVQWGLEPPGLSAHLAFGWECFEAAGWLMRPSKHVANIVSKAELLSPCGAVCCLLLLLQAAHCVPLNGHQESHGEPYICLRQGHALPHTAFAVQPPHTQLPSLCTACCTRFVMLLCSPWCCCEPSSLIPASVCAAACDRFACRSGRARAASA